MSSAPRTTPRSFTGRPRDRKTKRSVKVIDGVARVFITIGGWGTILAVGLVGVFLFLVAVKMFTPGKVELLSRSPAEAAQAPWRVQVDEYQLLSWAILPDGAVEVRRLDTGKVLSRKPVVEDAKLTAAATLIQTDDVALGFEDGSIRLGNIGFSSRFLNADEVTDELRKLPEGGAIDQGDGVVIRMSDDRFRSQSLRVELQKPIKSTGGAIRRIDLSISTTTTILGSLAADGKVRMMRVTKRENLATGGITLKTSTAEVPFTPPSGHGEPDHLLLSGVGDNLFLVWKDGRLLRYDARVLTKVEMAEDLNLLQDGATVTSLQFLIGKSTLLVGDSNGGLRAWFNTKPTRWQTVPNSPTPIEVAAAATRDKISFVLAKTLSEDGPPVTALAVSSRGRMFAAGYADGRVRLYNATTEAQLGELPSARAEPVQALAMSPKDDGLLVATKSGVGRYTIEFPHGDASLHSLFANVWYEGYPYPDTVWQSSSGDDAFETKYGLFPLVFGTLKATLYSMLFGVPMALLAAIYSSEFLDPRAKNIVKPGIEMMASLPSVVLGFLAALVFANWVEDQLPAMLLMFVTIPFWLVFGAFLWQLLPIKAGLILAPYRILFIIFLAIPFGVASAYFGGPWLEVAMFDGDVMLWLDGQRGSGLGAWLFLLLPLSACVVALLVAGVFNPWLRVQCANWSHGQVVWLDLFKFFVGVAVVLGLAYGFAALLTYVPPLWGSLWDPRGRWILFNSDWSWTGTYEQRNALIVGFVMGFAIIPIIYTIAEDALSTVPEHLRSASMACGATPWQTATRVIIPTAMSGLFSAVMIGLGRAVGETMIVLMAAGNTSVKDLNLFNGFRTLSANIAVELPEAVPNSTHYRTLFLAAVTLFLLTFVVNTGAEVIRQKFRKRAFEL